MTDRYHTLTVVLKEDTRDDDCRPLIGAILMLKGVASVTGHVSDVDSHMAEERARLAIGEKLLAICYPRSKERA
jgi:hypothetical protein